MIGQFGTFDIDNYGDLLYPIIFEKMYRVRGGNDEIYKFSFLENISLLDSGYSTKAIQNKILSYESQLDTHQKIMMIVGGGDLLRVDWNTIASHYSRVCLKNKKDQISFFLQKFIRKLKRNKLEFKDYFRSKYMNYPASGPFILDPEKSPLIQSIIYCSCGVPFSFSDSDKSQIAHAFNNADFIYLRDEESRNKLLESGVKKEIHVSPDIIVTLSDFFDFSTEKKKGEKILERFGVDIKQKKICFQAGSESITETDERVLIEQLKRYREKTNSEIFLLPIRRCHSDDKYLENFSRKTYGLFKYINVNSIFEIISVLAASDIFLGTSLHGNITAFSFGIPHLFAPINVDKREGFINMVNLSNEVKLRSWSEISDRLEWLESLEKEYFLKHASAAKNKVNKVFDLLFSRLNRNNT
ncbi:hypothetical protein OsccyDRAFT_4933 [Leptolyngbyaceae cyanobacterium JSC-12]|nr:hypothetical protein OsccyDRAFT_4933 [Leptolyngbyaceae cyanobacterium JSC-12]